MSDKHLSRGSGLGKPFTTAEEELLKIMLRQGSSPSEIAAALGCKRQRVQDKIYNMRNGYGRRRRRPSIRHRRPKGAQVAERKCLGCGENFISEGPYNRLCGMCAAAA